MNTEKELHYTKTLDIEDTFELFHPLKRPKKSFLRQLVEKALGISVAMTILSLFFSSLFYPLKSYSFTLAEISHFFDIAVLVCGALFSLFVAYCGLLENKRSVF